MAVFAVVQLVAGHASGCSRREVGIGRGSIPTATPAAVNGAVVGCGLWNDVI